MSELTADVVVIAGGPAGLCAAIEAADAGAKVVLFEKGSTTGGAANMGMGPLGIESRLQKLKQHVCQRISGWRWCWIVRLACESRLAI